MKPNILIVGVGSIGTRHLRNLLALGYRNLALCDPSREKLNAASRLGDFGAYTNVQRALKAEKPDIVFVCNPTHLHAQTALRALHSKAHVFIEKPISHSLARIGTLVREAEKKKRVVMVACNFRFHAGFRKLKAVTKRKTFGPPLFARVALGYYLPEARKGVSYKKVYAAGEKGGGVLLDSGVHAVEYLSALFGKITASALLKGKTRTLGMQSEETAGLTLQHESGIISSVALDYLSRKAIHRAEVVTDRGTLILDMRQSVLTFEDEKSQRVLYRGTRDMNVMFIEEIKHFLKCVKLKRQPLQGLEEARRVLNVLV